MNGFQPVSGKGRRSKTSPLNCKSTVNIYDWLVRVTKIMNFLLVVVLLFDYFWNSSLSLSFLFLFSFLGIEFTFANTIAYMHIMLYNSLIYLFTYISFIITFIINVFIKIIYIYIYRQNLGATFKWCFLCSPSAMWLYLT